MTNRVAAAKSLDEQASKASSLAEGQALAAEADRMRKTDRSSFSFPIPIARN